MGLPFIAFLAHTIFVYAKAACVIQIKFRVFENQSGSNGRSKSMQYLSEKKASRVVLLLFVALYVICL